MKFNPKEISLCKQVAEKHRKSISMGDQYLVIPKDKKTIEEICFYNSKIPEDFFVFSKDIRTTIPLWTISDCLEFLGGREGVVELWRTGRTQKWLCRLDHEVRQWWSAKTPLEACLKAVLAVLEEGKWT